MLDSGGMTAVDELRVEVGRIVGSDSVMSEPLRRKDNYSVEAVEVVEVLEAEHNHAGSVPVALRAEKAGAVLPAHREGDHRHYRGWQIWHDPRPVLVFADKDQA